MRNPEEVLGEALQNVFAAESQPEAAIKDAPTYFLQLAQAQALIVIADQLIKINRGKETSP